jgi:hypothetical protein
MIWAQETKRHLLNLRQIEFLLDDVLNEPTSLFVLEVLSQVLFNLIEHLSCRIRIEP